MNTRQENFKSDDKTPYDIMEKNLADALRSSPSKPFGLRPAVFVLLVFILGLLAVASAYYLIN